MNFAQIILPLNLKGTFTYKVPEDLMNKIEVGMRVLIPFGGKKIYTGIVAELFDEFDDSFVPKEIINLLDNQPIVPKQQLEFWNWMSSYYLCNLGEIYRFAFPSSLKLESETYVRLLSERTIDWQNLDANETYLLQALEVRQMLNLQEIEAFIPKKEIIKTINALIDERYISVDEKITEKYKAKEIAYLRINNEELKIKNNLAEIISSLKNARKQQELFLLILDKETENPEKPIRKSEIFDEGNFNNSQLKSLIEKKLVQEYYLEKDRIDSYEGELEEIEQLTENQKLAVFEINKAFEEDKNVLLHGITSSGKTHIYLEKIEDCVNSGKNVLLLLPEIALTKQITIRLEKKYGKKLGFYHNKLTDFERVEVWRKIKKNELQILIGTRNSLFLPFENLGLLIVDEEHDSAYKSRDSNFFFNAKDAAMMLAEFYNSKLILGSATPSLESYDLAMKDKLRYVPLNERFGNVDVPKFEIIDVKEAQSQKKIIGNFSQKMVDEINLQLEHKKQSIILHNRRGYANVIECETCGHVTYCSNCDVVMTYHKAANELKCHYCGHRAGKPTACPSCHGTNLNTKGVGVEQIEEETQKIFVDAEVDRMDVDAMRKKFAYEKLYEKLENGETDILVGTQMISKGLDFENIELVVIPKADALIYVQDFRAEERAYQLITQVAGRAGRVSGEGKILIQTYNPSHSIFELIKNQNIKEIYDYFLDERKKFLYPPFVKLIMIELKHRKEDKLNRASQFLGSVLRKYIPEECILGPEKSPIARINNLYQYQILLKFPKNKNYKIYKELLARSLEEFDEITAYKSIKRDFLVDF
ncbi:primosomal protein N' [Epilithonimonas ginsengisoli]|uniref:Replication restart protein PriA n=1 Tax=Epilithonimonas ginsengisoli TaxID=1245592 RepID=A0ABU4JM63_9FLAO|nr:MULTISPECIES: primosomal protein N' [Chryseobacterium group]MBV6880502.1 primosomal protein N' [Epilithonimonas sp. FP105]MDW8550804.1 primosomal protein N' [Epilithonimonas ginsengisoli]OAH69166.1 primosomal protein N' [Chryseobacterium sp. FP211-J200]